MEVAVVEMKQLEMGQQEGAANKFRIYYIFVRLLPFAYLFFVGFWFSLFENDKFAILYLLWFISF